MQYISFYKDRLPFKPKSNVVIYFDVTGVGMKLYYGIIDEYYDQIVRELQKIFTGKEPVSFFGNVENLLSNINKQTKYKNK